jgi:hypothetical protein
VFQNNSGTGFANSLVPQQGANNDISSITNSPSTSFSQVSLRKKEKKTHTNKNV